MAVGSTLRRQAMSTLSLRLADDDYEALRAIALLTGRPVAALARAAIRESVERFAQSAERGLVQADDLARRRRALALLKERATSADPARLVALGSVSTPNRPS
jgi:predicted DNA-binding protein